ncbi:helix-turn-helix domain-containing protein [Kitasatospora sp. NPDC057965]|uniref:helix-turn-helix domain-containing protein n=1 Tax=Kitasatospora sp. NPDC057965 TaxID=3346291 RepID=UPI0036D9791B
MNTTSEPGKSRDPELEQLAERLRFTRDYLGLSQQYVSDATGIPRSAVSDIERAVRRVDSLELKKLAKLYRLPVTYFLSDEADADAAELAAAGIPRALVDLTGKDLEEVANYARYLAFKRAAEREDTDSPGTAG